MIWTDWIYSAINIQPLFRAGKDLTKLNGALTESSGKSITATLQSEPRAITLVSVIQIQITQTAIPKPLETNLQKL